jgi:NADH-quinone oxidoreductase subunit G
LRKLSATLLQTAPGSEAEGVSALAAGSATNDPGDDAAAVATALRQPGAVILVGERLATVPGGLSAVARLAEQTGAKLAWVPRRAGDRGAVEAGLLPNLLPGGRPVSAWSQLGWAGTPETDGRDLSEILAAATVGELDALVVGATDPYDLPDPEAALEALESVDFVVSLEIRESAVTARADVVLPVATAVEKAGTFVNWEGRRRPFGETLPDTGSLTDARVLHVVADEMGAELNLPDVAAIRAELNRLGTTREHPNAPTSPPTHSAGARPQPQRGEAVLATWSLLLDAGRLQDGEPHLAGTAKAATALLNATTAEEVGVHRGERVRVSSDRGSITLPVEIADLPDRVVWLPTNSAGSAVRRNLAAGSGAVVRLRPVGAQ